MRATRILLAALGTVGLFACADQDMAAPVATAPPAPPPAAAVATTMERTAIVETVNMQERSVLLRGDAGAQTGVLATIHASPRVRNLAQIKAGDRVVYTVTDAVAAVVARPNDGATPVAAATVAVGAPEGQRPALSVADAKRVRVRVDSVDRRRNTVTFTDPEGTQRTVRVEDPRMREFSRTLRAGEMVDVVLLETADIRVLPAR